MKKILSALLVVLTATCANAQYFQYLYGTTQTDHLTSGHNAYMGGSVGHFLTGITTVNAPIQDMLIERTDLTGTTTSGAPQFQNIYRLQVAGTTAPLHSVAPRSLEFANGTGFGIAGSHINPTTNQIGVYFLRLNNAGGITGITSYFPNATFPVSSVIVTCITASVQNNNNFYICGFARDLNGIAHVFVLKVTIGGALLWSNIYDLNINTTSNYEIPYGIVESAAPNPGNGVVELMIVGQYGEFVPATLDAFLFRVNSVNGAALQNQTYGIGGIAIVDAFTSIHNSTNPAIAAAGNRYIITGYTGQMGTDDFWFCGVNQVGNLVWSNLFDYSPVPNANNDRCYDAMERINALNQYEYYLAGNTGNGPFGANDIMVVKTNQFGNGVAGGEFFYGSTADEFAYRIDQLNGFGPTTDGISVFGESSGFAGFWLGGWDHYLVKAYYNGVTACNYQINNVVQNFGPPFFINTPPGIVDQWLVSTIDCIIQSQATEQPICAAAAIAAGSNAMEHPVAQKQTPGAGAITISPNPMVSQSAEVDVRVTALADEKAEIRVIDMLGREYAYKTAEVTKGESHMKLELPALRAGTYMVTVTSASSQYKTILLVK